MENASKALLIAGAILLCIVIIAVGMFIYNSSAGTSIDDSIEAMSTNEIDAHNSEYIMYEGEQTGSNIKALFRKIISNVKRNKYEVSKIPGVCFEDSKSKKILDSRLPENGNISDYLEMLQSIQSSIDMRHKYWVEVNYQKNGLIDYINISYDLDNLIEQMKRN